MIAPHLMEGDPVLTGMAVGAAVGTLALIVAIAAKKWLDRPRR